MPKPKAYSSKKYKKFHGIVAQNLSCINKKNMKNGSQMKSSIIVNTLDVGPLWHLEHVLKVFFTMFMHFISYRV